jgi:hypothetical protein
MTVVSSCDGVMGAEERLSSASGYDFAKNCLQSGESRADTEDPAPRAACVIPSVSGHRPAIRISFSSSVILMPGWSRRNRIKEAGSLEE